MITQAPTAKTLGSVVSVALAQAAGAQEALRQIQMWIDHLPHEYDNDSTKMIRLIVGNWFAPGRTFVLDDLNAAIYDSLPRGGEQVSY